LPQRKRFSAGFYRQGSLFQQGYASWTPRRNRPHSPQQPASL